MELNIKDDGECLVFRASQDGFVYYYRLSKLLLKSYLKPNLAVVHITNLMQRVLDYEVAKKNA